MERSKEQQREYASLKTAKVQEKKRKAKQVKEEVEAKRRKIEMYGDPLDRAVRELEQVNRERKAKGMSCLSYGQWVHQKRMKEASDSGEDPSLRSG